MAYTRAGYRERPGPVHHLPPAGGPAAKLWHYHFEFSTSATSPTGLLRLLSSCSRHPDRPSQDGGGIQVDLFQRTRSSRSWPSSRSSWAWRTGSRVLLRPRKYSTGCAATAGRQVAGRLGGGQAALVQLLGGQRLLPQRQDLAGEPGHPARLPAHLHRKVQRGETLERPMEAVVAERDRIVAEYTELIDSDEDRATFGAKLGLARTCSVRGEPQLLRRALGSLGGLAQDARPGPSVCRGGVLHRPGRRVPAEQARGDRGAVRPLPRLGGRRTSRGPSTGRGRWPAATGS